ncbi:MAG: serine/threonine-protein kinase PknK [Hyalangium sp.]|uniref:serine/threonine-protein kinase n=1 Tax=Hyalangium sp. TaxID=2028555 RepID=UPI003899BB55
MPRCLTCGQRWEGGHLFCLQGASPSSEPPATPKPLPALAFPGYELEHTVAQGGFGTLLAARRRRDGLRVAIKVLHRAHPPAGNAFTLEFEALRAVGPPTVPEVYETGWLADGPPYFVMQFIPHPLLAQRLAQKNGPLPEAGQAALALAQALDTVHRRGFIHCDLKPENIFLDEAKGALGLFDFGLARPLSPSPPEADSARGLAQAGTAEYMAPEQCAGEEDLDERTDVYALGVILYEMLTGRTPFFGAAADVRQAHLSRRPPRPSELAPVSATLEEVVLRCLAKERSRRYASAQELAAALRYALEHPSAAPSHASGAPARPAASQHRSVALLFLRSGANPLAVQKALARSGGQLAFRDGTRFAAVFDPEAEANPLQRAHLCAEHLCAEGVAANALVDVALVRVQRRPQGPPRYLTPLFSQWERYPTEEDPPTLLLTTVALEGLPELKCVPIPERQGLFRRALPEAAREDTSVVQLANGVLVGRQGELAELVQSARGAVHGRAPTLASVLGDRGQGKSHLATALVHLLREQEPEARVVSLRAREPVQGDPESTLRLLLHEVLGECAAQPEGDGSACRTRCEELLGAPLAQELWPSVSFYLGWRASADLRSLAAAPGALRSLAVRATGELLAATARVRPLLFLLDDAHFAEDVALDALEYATRAESELPLWICVLARPGFERSRPRWATRAARRTTLSLGPLPLPEAMELCRTGLRPAENVPAEALEQLAERAQRTPLFIVELVRGLKRQGMVRQRSGGSWYLATDELDRMPELRLVEWLAQHELGALPAELVSHARLCAVLGGDFTLGEVEGVVSALEREDGAADFPLDARHATRRLVELGPLVDHPQEGLRFRNELIRQEVARSLPETQRWRLHHAAHLFYMEASARESRFLPRLAFHAACAGLHSEAASLYIDLAESARGRHAYLEAEATYSRALELLPQTADSRCLTALRGRGLMRYRVGRYEDSLADLARARQMARELGNTREEIEVMLDEATAFDWSNDWVRSEERVLQAMALATTSMQDSRMLQVRLLLGMGRAQWRLGQWENARGLLAAASEQARDLGDAGYESRIVCLILLGFILPNLGRIDDAQRVLEECITACTERGDRLHLGAAINNRRNLWVALDNLPRALEDQHRFKQLGRELGMVGWEYFAEHNLGELHYQAGDTRTAMAHIARAMELERHHPEVAPRPWGLLLYARVLAYEGKEVPARHALDTIRQVLAERPGAEWSPSESVLLSLVELTTRPASAEEWQALQARSDKCSVEQEPLEVLEVLALARLKRGERQEAVRLLEEALRRAEHTPTIMRPRLRHSLRQALGT